MKKGCKGIVGIVSVVVFLLLHTGMSVATDATWEGGTGNWNDTGMWNSAAVPDDTTNVLIDGDKASQDSVVNVNTSAAVGNLIIDAGDELNINNSRTLTVHGVTILNNGTLSLNSDGSATYLRLADDVTLTGGGVLIMSDQAQNHLYGSGGGPQLLTNSAGHTIRGSGSIGGSTSTYRLGLNNQGLIDANQTTALNILAYTVNNVDPINTGILQASNGGTLNINSTDITNTDATIQALDNSTVILDGGSVTGGTLATTGSGVINLDGARLNTLTLDGDVRIGNADTADLAGTITNQGTILLNSSGSTTRLRLAEDVTLTGGGVLTMSDQAQNYLYGSSGGPQLLTNSAGHIIQGSGRIGGSTTGTLLGLLNQGLIDANQSAGLTVRAYTASSQTPTNTGIMQASNGGTLTIESTDLTNTDATIQALDNSTVILDGGSVTGGTLATSGSGVINLDGARLNTLTLGGDVRINNADTADLAGTITNQGTILLNSSGSTTRLRLAEDVTLTGTGVLTMSDQTQNNLYGSTGGPQLLTNSAGHTIQGSGRIGGTISSHQLGLINHGLIDANQTTKLVITPSTRIVDANIHPEANMINTGTLRASGTGGMELTNRSFLNLGTVEALNGSNVTYATSATTLDNNAGVLENGTWRAVSSGEGATIIIRGAAITQIGENAEVVLSGADSVFQVASNALESSLTNNRGILRVLDNRDYSTTNDLTNAGLLQLGGGTFDAGSLTNTATGEIYGYGTLADPVLSHGLVRASGGNLTGTIDGQSGTVQIDPGASLTLSGHSDAEYLVHNGTTAGSLALGEYDFTVDKDYTNANFGTGNAFDHRANVTGSGQIIGKDADMSITGDVSVSGSDSYTLDFGNVRGSTSKILNYQVENSGTGADIRGALQNAANGGNITDGRLSGAGMTADNFAPIASGNDSGDLGVTFTATSGGALDSQTIDVVSNFDNVNRQTIQIEGFASALAQGNATPTGPIELGNFRVGVDEPSQNFAVENTTSGPGAEQLGIGSAIATGNFAVTNNLGSGPIAGGASQPDALSASVSGGVAGINTGALNIQYTTDGTNIDGTFTAMNVNSQDIALSATGYNMAVGSTSPGPVVIANQRVGDGLSQALTVDNIAPTGDYTERLNAAFGTGTGPIIDNSGSISLLEGGMSDDTSMSVRLSTDNAGLKSGTVTINYETDGTGTSGLDTLSAGSQTINVSGNVYQVAQPMLAINDVSFANQRVGAAAYTQNVGITNTSDAPVGFQESLNASFNGTTGSAVATGTVNQLAQGNSDSDSLAVSLDTSAAGALNGTATLGLVSTGAGTSGLGNLALGTQEITISGNVYQLAQGNLNNTSLDFGVVQVGQSVSQALSISNIATGAAGFVEDLNVSFGNSSGTGSNLISGSGSISGLLAGSTNTSSMLVSVDTGNAGTVNGGIAVDYFSAGAVNGVSNGLGVLAVGSQDFGVIGTIQTTGTVVDQADPVINTTQPIVLGNVREGSTSPSAFVSVTNQATGNDQAGLNADITGNAMVTASGNFDMLLPGDTDGTSLQVGMNTTTAGAINGTATIAFVSDAGNHGGGQLTLPSQDVQVQGAVYRLAQGAADPDPVVFGNLRINTTAEQALTITNTAANDGYSEVLSAAFGSATGDTSDNAGTVALLAAGSSNASSMMAGLDTSVAGVRSGTVTVDYASDGEGTTGEAAISVGSQTIDVTGTVYRLASPEVDTAQPVVLAARVGDATPTQNLSVTNQSPDAYTEGLKAEIGTLTAGFNGTGSIGNLAAAGTDNTSLSVGLADTSVSQNITGTVGLDFHSTGAGTTGAADIAVGSESVEVEGRVYQQAEAQLDTTSVDFGIVHIGDTVAAHAVSVTNVASSAALNDTLAAGFENLPLGPFNGSGSVSGLGSGQTDASNLEISLDTTTAGYYSHTGNHLQFISQNPDMADLYLDYMEIHLQAQINNYANPWFNLNSGPGSLDRDGDDFILNLGTILDTEEPMIIELALLNDTFGPSDLLSGSFTHSTSAFSLDGFDPFFALAAEESTNPLYVEFDPSIVGLGFFSEFVSLSATGFNASGFEQIFNFNLVLQAKVEPIPEPGTLALLMLGMLLLGVVVKRRFLLQR